jgi:hypothetical protein
MRGLAQRVKSSSRLCSVRWRCLTILVSASLHDACTPLRNRCSRSKERSAETKPPTDASAGLTVRYRSRAKTSSCDMRDPTRDAIPSKNIFRAWRVLSPCDVCVWLRQLVWGRIAHGQCMTGWRGVDGVVSREALEAFLTTMPRDFSRHRACSASTCDIETVTFSAEPQAELSSATITNVRDPNRAATLTALRRARRALNVQSLARGAPVDGADCGRTKEVATRLVEAWELLLLTLARLMLRMNRALFASGVILLALTANACTPDNKASSASADDWSELCAKEDCERFPVGYYAQKIGVDFFYSPVSSRVDWDAGNTTQVYVERDAQGAVVRAARLDEQNHFELGPPCCSEVSTRLGLPIPQSAGETSPGKIQYFATGSFPLPIPSRGKYKDLFPFQTAHDLQAAGLASFDDSFWLVYEGEPVDPDRPKDPRREIVLLSKSPMLFGQYVVLECTRLCSAETFRFPAEPQLGQPMIRLVNLSPSIPDACWRGPCDYATAFAQAPETLIWIEQILEELKKRP